MFGKEEILKRVKNIMDKLNTIYDTVIDIRSFLFKSTEFSLHNVEIYDESNDEYLSESADCLLNSIGKRVRIESADGDIDSGYVEKSITGKLIKYGMCFDIWKEDGKIKKDKVTTVTLDINNNKHEYFIISEYARIVIGLDDETLADKIAKS